MDGRRGPDAIGTDISDEQATRIGRLIAVTALLRLTTLGAHSVARDLSRSRIIALTRRRTNIAAAHVSQKMTIRSGHTPADILTGNAGSDRVFWNAREGRCVVSGFKVCWILVGSWGTGVSWWASAVVCVALDPAMAFETPDGFASVEDSKLAAR